MKQRRGKEGYKTKLIWSEFTYAGNQITAFSEIFRNTNRSQCTM
jgi:hypothetical protein